jgi:hypothetical protein
MFLVQIYLPLFDNDGHRLAAAEFEQVSTQLTDRFGGVTAFLHAPAKGRWKEKGSTSHDDIVVVEVMCEAVDAAWWRTYREGLEIRFRQKVILVRAQAVQIL